MPRSKKNKPITLGDVQRSGRWRNGHQRKNNEQIFKTKAVNNWQITLVFTNKTFRKHFLLPSHGGRVDDDTKAWNLVSKRADPTRFRDYGKTTTRNTIIDLTRANINTVMVDMADDAMNSGLSAGYYFDKFQFTFTDNAVWDAVRNAMGDTITFGLYCHARDETAKKAEYHIEHCTGT